MQRLADAGQLLDPVLGHELRDVPLEIIKRPGGVRVSAGLERVLALQFEQNGDFLQDVGDFGFIHV